MIDFSYCRSVPLPDGTLSGIKKHVKEGVECIVNNPYFFNTDEMGAMKSAQSIISAQTLFTQGTINRVIVIAPASVRGVWYDKELGELQKHLWYGLKAKVVEWHSSVKHWFWSSEGKENELTGLGTLEWIITNYEFIRNENRTKELKKFCNSKTLLVLDESSYIKNYKSQSTKACVELRKACSRVLLLNGTPVSQSPEDLFSQANLMDPSILECKYITHFRAKYAIMEAVKGAGGKALTDPRGHAIQTAVGWKNIPELQARIAPYCIRRMKADCLDLPPVLPPVTLYVPLEPKTWAIYKEMRDDMVVWLEKGGVAAAQQAAVKAIRLAQITSGFIGGIEDDPFGNDESVSSGIDFSGTVGNLLESLPIQQYAGITTNEDKPRLKQAALQFISREKLDFTLKWFGERLDEDRNLKLLVWCRFRPELERLLDDIENNFLHVKVSGIWGGQKPREREEALRLLDPRTAPSGPVFFGGTFGTGALGINLTASHVVLNLSYDYSYFKWLQSLARVDRPGQVHPVSYFNVVATGPSGQKTLDHAIVKARQAKEDVSVWTTSAWVRALRDE